MIHVDSLLFGTHVATGHFVEEDDDGNEAYSVLWSMYLKRDPSRRGDTARDYCDEHSESSRWTTVSEAIEYLKEERKDME